MNSASQTSAQQQMTDNLRRSKSALPLLKNHIRFNKASLSTGSTSNNNNNSTNISFDQMRTNIMQHENQLTMNLNNCFNASSYKLINAPVVTSVHKTPKKMLYSPNNSASNLFEKGGRGSENSGVNKTSL